MNKILYVIITYLPIFIACTDKYVLPTLYEMEDYSHCMEDDNLYCKVDIRLSSPNSKNNTVWKLIQESLTAKHTYDRSIIHRAICVPKNESFNSDSVRKFTEMHISEKMKPFGLSTFVQNIICTRRNLEITLYDVLFMSVLISYILFVLYVTFYHSKNVKQVQKKASGVKSQIITCFSMVSNWGKICNFERNEDFNRLKSIQGVRVYTMFLIIFAHTILSYCILYISNTDEAEKVTSNVIMVYFFVLCTCLTQIFFLISSWILTVQIYHIQRVCGQFALKQMFMVIINRYLRLIVCLTVVVLSLKTCWCLLIDSPVMFESTRTAHMACKQNWLPTLLLVNNYLYLEDMCGNHTWQLSVDFQLYVLATITIYIILKFKLNEWKVLGFLFVFSCLLYGTIIYKYNMDIIIRWDVNSVRRYFFFRSLPTVLLYTSTHSNWSTSIVGIFFGILYTKNKHRKIECNNKVIVTFWLLMFFGLPSLIIFIAKNEFRGIAAAILGALIKPLFSLGLGIGILGMSHNIGGSIKRMCEHKIAIWISNFLFSIYLFQPFVIFTKGAGSYSPIKFDINEVFATFFFIDVSVTIAVGIVATLIFEQPGVYLQKMLLSRLYDRKVKSEKRQ